MSLWVLNSDTNTFLDIYFMRGVGAGAVYTLISFQNYESGKNHLTIHAFPTFFIVR